MRHPSHFSHLFRLLLGAEFATACVAAARVAAASGSAPVRTVDGGIQEAGTAAGTRPDGTSAIGASPGPTGSAAPAVLSASTGGLPEPGARNSELLDDASVRAADEERAETPLVPSTEEYRLGQTTMKPQDAGENDHSAVKDPSPLGEDHGTAPPGRKAPAPGTPHRRHRRQLRRAPRPYLSGRRPRGRGHPAPAATARRVHN
ncbi:hypothetical protein [Streptomyces sp. NBC_00059]|uniref:hypothetical protein n=1 Tax=Streptomyces sp. NBC_00059 TaxID=2975635 RepID=UPI00225978CC|nr:hypothetical protein [Streptomyces sp. NBC_00059]MCX5414793.1 hypothetical protein [Streptomyces sp. NBC_00059]